MVRFKQAKIATFLTEKYANCAAHRTKRSNYFNLWNSNYEDCHWKFYM